MYINQTTSQTYTVHLTIDEQARLKEITNRSTSNYTLTLQKLIETYLWATARRIENIFA